MPSSGLLLQAPALDAVARDRQRITRVQPWLDPGSDAFHAAQVLLAGPSSNYVIDRIATRCRLPRPWVARVVRRLVDNGVWGPGLTPPWSGPEDDAFWHDVAVGNGLMLRRISAGGAVEWAGVDSWVKAFDAMDDDSGIEVSYIDRPRSVSVPILSECGALLVAEPEPEPEPERARPSRGVPRTPASPALFPQASWLC